jgi:transcriptional regulator NrdR family protein
MSQLPCPLCNNSETWVIDTRPTKSGTRRRYGCPRCKERFTTFESVVRDKLVEDIERKLIQIAHLKDQMEKLEEDVRELRLKQQAEKESKAQRKKPASKLMSQKEREMLADRKRTLREIVGRVQTRMGQKSTNEEIVNGHNQRKETD